MEKKILNCASQQGNNEATWRLAAYSINVEKNFESALKYYQLATIMGHEMSASMLVDAFKPTTTPKDYYYLAVKPDPERSARYQAIVKEIDASNETATFPDIDKIVPLPPAELPEWDGTFEYKKTGKPIKRI